MKVLWIGVGMGPKTKEKILANNGKILSGYVSQMNIIEGLDALDVDMDTLNAPQIGGNVLNIIEAEHWSRNGKNADVSVGYKNASYLNRLFKQKALCDQAKKWAEKNKNENDVTVFVYSMHAPFLAAACEIKKILPQTKICLIVLDLPQYMDLKMSKLKKLLKAIDWQRIRGYMKKVHKYVLYAEPMADFLGLKNGRWTVMEGSYDSAQSADEGTVPDEGKTSVMYSGVLDLRYGIPELLDAMDMLDDTYELWLTGMGNAEDLIRERALRDPRIKFYGYLPSRQDLLNKQAQATMLISPRRDTEEASKYCFPSKLFEYMASGRPVISCFLAGIPKEYHPYLVELPSATAQQIAQVICQVAQLPRQDRDEAGRRAKAFVLERKNKFAQAKKISAFVLDGESK